MMRLGACIILALGSTSSWGVAALRPRSPSAPPYEVPSESKNSSSYGLTGTGYSTSSSSSSIYTPDVQPSPSTSADAPVVKPATSTSADEPKEAPPKSSRADEPPVYASSSGSTYTPDSNSSSASPIYAPTGYVSSTPGVQPAPSNPVHAPTGYVSSSGPRYKPTGASVSSGSISKQYGNSTAKFPNKCSGKTLNVLDASLDWWYTRTLYNVVSTISVLYNSNDTRTGWTILPATTSFNLESAMASPTCESSLTWNTNFNMSLWDVSCTPAPTPVAASTTIITQTAYKDLNATTGTGGIPNVVKTPAPATITIPSSAGAYAEGTPFVYFSAYEIVSKSETTHGNGSAGCAEATQTIQMAEPFSFEYTDGDVNGTKLVGAGVTGDVAPAFLQVVGESAKAGSWVAAPTVAVVVQDIYVAQAVLAAKAGPFNTLMTTQSILQTPEPTLPPGFTTGKAETDFPSVGFTGRVESTAATLDVPTQNQKTKTTPSPGNPQPTKQSPGGTKQTTGPDGRPTPAETTGPDGRPTPVETTGPDGRPTPVETTSPDGRPTPVETTGPDGRPTPVVTPDNEPGSSKTTGRFDNIVSAILSAVTPTNAVQVLQQAQASFSTTNPTVAAILNGISPGSSTVLGTGPDGKPTLVIDGTTITANSKTEFNVGTATLTPGGTVVDHGTTVSLDSSMSAVVVNGVTYTASPASITPAPILTIGGTTYAPNGGAYSGSVNGPNNGPMPTYVIGGQTLTPGGVITVDGTTISLGPSGSSVVVNGVTQTFGSASPASITAPPVLTIGGETFTAINSGFTYDVEGETLTPGGMATVTINGKAYIVSLGPGATVLEIETIGPNGQITATTYETLTAGSGSQSTVTSIVGASSGSRPSAGPSYSVPPSMANAASGLQIQLSGIYIFLTALIPVIWL